MPAPGQTTHDLPLKLHLPSFDNARVLVAGDVVLDRYWHGGTSRISPEAPVPVVRVDAEEERAGGAGNVALNIRALGAPVALVGLAGKDPAGERLAGLLNGAGVETGLVSTAQPTITKLRVISQHQQLIRLDFEDGFDTDAADTLARRFENQVRSSRVAVLSDYGKGALAQPQRLIRAAREAGVPVLVDPKGRDFARYAGADVITPNWAEFEAAAGPCGSQTEMLSRARTMIRELQLKALLITRGELGMSLIRADRDPVHMPAQAREVFDVTGAGDTVIGVLAASMATGIDLPDACAIANLAAGIVVGKLGTATASPPELRRAMHEAEQGGYGVLESDTLLQSVADARAHGERIVFTNGCFDILHSGHVAYLDECRQLGDRLIVAVNDDQSVRRLKGEGRPVNPLEDRMAVLSGLAAVDWVVSFGEDTPRALIERVKPDVLVKGGDYRPQDIAGFDTVTANGGEVVVVDYRPGRSTTELIERIHNTKDKAS